MGKNPLFTITSSPSKSFFRGCPVDGSGKSPGNSSKSKIKYARAGVGIAINLVAAYFFYYALYPLVIWKAGIVKGGLMMTTLSFILSLAALVIYIETKKDWFGIEAVKKKINAGSGKAGRLAAWAMEKCRPLALVGLSIKFDPFITTICLRNNGWDGKLTRRDGAIFITSVLVSNGYWLFVMHMGEVMLGHF